MQEITLSLILYASAVGILQSGADVWLAKPYVLCKQGKNYVYAILFVMLFLHDLFFSLWGESENYVLYGIEMAVFYPLLSLVLWKLCKGSTYHNFVYLLALEWCFNIIGMLFVFPFYMIICNFEIEKVGLFLDQPSALNLMVMVVLYTVDAWVTAKLWSVLWRKRGKKFEIFCFVCCILDIVCLMMLGWKTIVICFPVIMALMIMLFLRQNSSEKLADEQFAYYRALEETQRQKEKEISEIRHDIANHIKVMEEMSNEEDGRNILKKIDKKGDATFTGIPVLDCLISEKEGICLEKGISFQKEGTLLGEISITEYELISLFANLLDNAIEATEKTEEKEIHLSMEKQQGYLRIVLRNSKLESSNPIKSDFKTTKANKKFHGIGNRIIRDIVNNHNGRIKYEEKGKELVAIVLVEI